MIRLSIIRDLVAIFGVIAGFSYYVLTVRANRKNQELVLKAQEQALETRQTQLFMSIYQTFQDKNFQRDYLTTIYKYEWNDAEDFRQKYGQEIDNEARISILSLESFFEGLGVLVYRKQIDLKLIDDLMRSYIINYWEKMRSIYIPFREINPLIGEWSEYLYNELKKTEYTPAYQR